MKEELFEGLSNEQIAKIKNCKSQEEILALAKEEGIELNNEQLEAVSGGNSCLVKKIDENAIRCPKCGSTKVISLTTDMDSPICKARCQDCGHEWAPVVVPND